MFSSKILVYEYLMVNFENEPRRIVTEHLQKEIQNAKDEAVKAVSNAMNLFKATTKAC